MCKALRASMLVLLLSCTAQAGWMQGGSPEPPPPPPPSSELVLRESPDGIQEAPADGDTLDGTTGVFIEAALNVLSGVLSLT